MTSSSNALTRVMRQLDRIPVELRGIARRSRLYRPYVAAKYRRSTLAREEIFTGFYEDNVWGDVESRSGHGSSLSQTATLRLRLPEVLRELGVRSLLDVPCGDYAWMRYVDLGEIDYIGADIVTTITEDLQERFGDERHRFAHIDLVSDPLPAVDAVMVRDLFLHLPNGLILKSIANLKASDATLLLASTYASVSSNPDVEHAGHRFPNLELPPFDLPAPLCTIVEGGPSRAGERPDKTLGVWRLADLRGG